MVSIPVADAHKKSDFAAKVAKPFKKSSRGTSLISPKQLSAVGGMDSIRGKLLAEGISPESAELIAQSRRQGTKSYYESAWRKFCGWCSGKKIDPFGCSLASVLQFLTKQFHEGWEYNTIAGYRSATSAFHNPIGGCKVGDHPRLSALKGIFNLKPPKPSYPFIWDVEQVLNYLKNLTIGSNTLVMLLALTTASRTLEKTHVDIRYMVKSHLFYCFTLPKPT